MSTHNFWHHPEDPNSFRRRVKRDRAREIELQEHEARITRKRAELADTWRDAPTRDHPAFTEAGEDLHDIHAYIKGLIYRPLIVAAVVVVVGAALIIGGING